MRHPRLAEMLQCAKWAGGQPDSATAEEAATQAPGLELAFDLDNERYRDFQRPPIPLRHFSAAAADFASVGAATVTLTLTGTLTGASTGAMAVEKPQLEPSAAPLAR